ncbi:putative amidohydrolase family protein [Phaeoacremonium minimum UCRPA7]|uniref:Putative amidohydrolase family protein n=1 Tax=Phaeoacremonium minimum (strain UCR-PA7) TaxID=1286976 RepID=R8B968_PHAM7|nr:putative amidohydrolase family protein [Phaeoacremonium minimum UCRPA7]EON95826.1 putative amidohydrolase family protein [Phaeoacremonium minimum UCRPA7]
MHALIMGQSILKVGLEHCKNLEDIRSAIREYAKTNTTVPRISCRGWMHSMTPDGVNSAMLDDLDPLGRPIFVDTKDLHSTWCSTTAVKELDIQTTPDPVGGKIHRDADGNPTGLLEEAGVFTIVWPHIARVASLEERAAAIRSAVEAYNTVGYTGLIDMAMDEDIWEALQKLISDDPNIPMRFAAYWLIKPSATEAEHLKQVERAAELAAQFNATKSPGCRVVGIKIICDGIIDSCTASLKEPYSSNGASTDAIWTKPQLLPVVRKADSLGLQVALHAIGDATIKMAIDVIEECVTPTRRPRIEHLELSSPEDAARLGRLGITASIQPVHSDPAILRAWPRLIGEHRCGRAFAYREFADGGAPLALGSDAPTAPHAPLANMYVATTRRSAREPGPDGPAAFNEHFALGLCESVVAGTKGAAYSTFAETWSGGLQAGMKADFVVCDMEWEKEKLLAAKVSETWFGGRRVYGA